MRWSLILNKNNYIIVRLNLENDEEEYLYLNEKFNKERAMDALYILEKLSNALNLKFKYKIKLIDD